MQNFSAFAICVPTHTLKSLSELWLKWQSLFRFLLNNIKGQSILTLDLIKKSSDNIMSGKCFFTVATNRVCVACVCRELVARGESSRNLIPPGSVGSMPAAYCLRATGTATAAHTSYYSIERLSAAPTPILVYPPLLSPDIARPRK